MQHVPEVAALRLSGRKFGERDVDGALWCVFMLWLETTHLALGKDSRVGGSMECDGAMDELWKEKEEEQQKKMVNHGPGSEGYDTR